MAEHRGPTPVDSSKFPLTVLAEERKHRAEEKAWIAKNLPRLLPTLHPLRYATLEFVRCLQGDIPVFKHDGYEYTLRPAIELLHHSNDYPGCHYFNLSYQDGDNRELLSFHNCDLPDSKTRAATFMALGWLRDSYGASPATKSERTTKYIVLWNLATKPTSLWIVYDYKTLDPDWELQLDCECGSDCTCGCYLNKLQHRDFHNKMYQRKEKYTDRVSNVFADGNADCKADGLFTAKYFSHAPKPPHDDNGEPGFFGMDKPFDLAMLAPDIAQWQHGLEPALIKKCLEASHVCLGDSLRAVRTESLIAYDIDITGFISELQDLWQTMENRVGGSGNTTLCLVRWVLHLGSSRVVISQGQQVHRVACM